MKARIVTVPADRVLLLPDGPLQLAKDDVLVVAVVKDFERAAEVVRLLAPKDERK